MSGAGWMDDRGAKERRLRVLAAGGVHGPCDAEVLRWAVEAIDGYRAITKALQDDLRAAEENQDGVPDSTPAEVVMHDAIVRISTGEIARLVSEAVLVERRACAAAARSQGPDVPDDTQDEYRRGQKRGALDAETMILRRGSRVAPHPWPAVRELAKIAAVEFEALAAQMARLSEANVSTATGGELDVMAGLFDIDAERFRREAPRREVDRLLAEDARRIPEFADARKRAVLGALEECRLGLMLAERARDILSELHLYEQHRGGERRPRASPGRLVDGPTQAAIEVYERARGCR